MGAYENSMHEEGSCEDFAREIKRMVDKMVVTKNRPALYDMFFDCRKTELYHENGIVNKDGRRLMDEALQQQVGK